MSVYVAVYFFSKRKSYAIQLIIKIHTVMVEPVGARKPDSISLLSLPNVAVRQQPLE